MNTNKYLLAGIFGGLFLIPFIPFIVADQMFFPFIVGKNFVFRILVEILFALWAILALRDERYRPKFSWVLVAFTFFLAVMSLADFFGENPMKSMWSNFERMEGLVTLLHLYGYFVVAGSLLQSEKMWQRLFSTSIFASVLICLYGVVQLSGRAAIHQGGVRLDASLGNATYLAIYLVFHIFLTGFLALRYTNIGLRIFLGAIMLFETFLLYHTATRGAILGLIGGAALFSVLIVLFGKEHKMLRKGSLVLLGGVLLLVGGFYTARNTAFVQESPTLSRFASISPNIIQDKTQARGYVWPMAIQGFKDRPILGWGQENFNYVFNTYYDPRMHAHEQWFDRTHNVVLDWLIAGGIAGLLSYLSLFAAALYILWKKSSWGVAEKSLFTALLAAYFFHNLFVFDNITSYILFVMILAYFHSSSAESFTGNISKQLSRHFSDKRFSMQFYAPLLIAATLFVLYSWNVNAILANKGLIRAIGPESNMPEKALESFKQSLSYDTFANQEIREQIMQATIGVRQKNTPLELQKQYYELAKTEMEKMIREAPNDLRHFLFYGSILNAFGDYGNALVFLERARELSPRKQSVQFEIGSLYLRSGKYPEALKIFEEAYTLAPSFDEARILYGVAALYAGRYNLGNEILDTHPEYMLDERVVRAYFDAKQYDKIIKSLAARIVKEPLNPNIRFNLAALYIEMGQKGNAIRVLRDAALAIPSIAEQAQSYITDIEAGKNP